MKLDKSEAIPEWISGSQWRRTQVEDWKTPAQRGTEFSQELPLDLIGQTFWPDSLSALKFIFKHKRRVSTSSCTVEVLWKFRQICPGLRNLILQTWLDLEKLSCCP